MSGGGPMQPRGIVRKTSRLILNIILEHALGKIDQACHETEKEKTVENFLTTIDVFVASNRPVEACLPAFPFKSANKVYKVLGSLPDKAEELALDRLNAMCKRIRNVYAPGATVTIISDGLTYNDLLCISDQDTWAYGEALRKMAEQKKFTLIHFARMRDLLDLPLPDKLSEIVYVANCTTFRRVMLNRYGRDDLDIDHEIRTNPDTKLTYLGYKRFLESDLKHIFPRGADRSGHSYKRDCKYIARQMLIRGHAFAGAIKHAFPNHLRLSIHESMNAVKVSISLLNTRTGFTTPWHCTVAQLVNGEWISAPHGEFADDDAFELMYEDGRPSYFREKTSVSLSSSKSSSYLNLAKPLSTKEYLEKAFTPPVVSQGLPSPDVDSVFSPRPSDKASTATTPETASSPTVTAKGLRIVIEDPVLDAPLSVPYGRRLIPQIMDELAAAEPQRTVFSLASFSNGSLELQHISARAFTRAVDKTAWWLHNHVGRPASIQPVGYIGPHDLRHILLTYACVKSGYAALYLSPKNNTEGALAVLATTACNIWVNACDATPVPLVKEILQQRPMTLLQLPHLDELLDPDESAPTFSYTKSFDEAINDPFCFLHTSGTTGVPKPIPWSHGLIGTTDAVRLLPPVEGTEGLLPWTTDWKDGDRIYSSFPMSHGAGIIMDILMPALFKLHCVLGPVGVLPNINLVEALAEKASIDIWSMVPSLVDELGETPEVLSKLRPSKFICASGGPVSPVSAGKVNKVVRVLNLTGTTEGLFIGNLVPSREDWFWFCFHPYSGFEFKEIEEDTYEHWVHRNEHSAHFQGIFHTFPEKQSVNFKDLYMRHPTKPNLWAFKGRSDDLVVLSNGYKISPLEAESFITTHPAIKGCLVFGTGKPQAGLLIELIEPGEKTEELLDSIWETVKKTNSMSRNKGQLLRDFVTFAEPDKPFFRTDKGTVKRPATLKLYADYIERFYSSRSEDLDHTLSFNVSSESSVQDHIRKVLAFSLPEVQDASIDADLFALGLDSLSVFAAVKTIRAGTGLGERLGPRHIYGSPTIASLAATVSRLTVGASAEKTANEIPVDENTAKIQHLLALHKARQSFALNEFDYVNPNHGMGLALYFPIRDGVTFEQVFANLQEGLDRTFDLIPGLSGKMINRSEQDIGYTKGDLCVTIPSFSQAASARSRLVYKDLSNVLPPFDKLRDGGFAPSAFQDSLVLRDDPFPEMPADIFVGQANFVLGGCIVAVDLNHCCLDGLGAMVALKAWAENCRYLQGDRSATCSWYDPDSFNHSLPEILHDSQGDWDPLDKIDPSTWQFLPFFPPDDAPAVARPKYPLQPTWPLPRAERPLRTTLFLLSPSKLEALKQTVQADAISRAPDTPCPSVSDIVQAFFWRAAIRARYRVATTLRKQSFPSDAESILELPTDGRPYFSPLLPASYMGSMLILNRISLPLSTIVADSTSIAEVALALRNSSSRITPALVHNAFTLLRSLPEHSTARFSTANMGLEHMHAMISNMMLFPAGDLNFGDAFFDNGGVPESLRPQLERGNGRFRFLVIFPLKKDGGVELVLGTHAEELEMFRADEEFARFVELVDCSS
ncbi:transferase family protein [Aspergillus foveolatus]|uniref:transferase family protein n=1 Tax=Aspergillus foveolatus TaxID=210207 RepID=UPI003CCD39A7